MKVYYIIPLLNQIDFLLKDKEIRGFYELPMSYETDKFILNGTCDFVVSEGLVESKKPYFFIQEFKRHEDALIHWDAFICEPEQLASYTDIRDAENSISIPFSDKISSYSEIQFSTYRT